MHGPTLRFVFIPSPGIPNGYLSQNLRHSVKNHTVDRLKQILAGLNDECGSSLFKSGKKQELIDRIIAQLDQYRQTKNVAIWTKAKAVLYLVKNTGM
jgi:E3 SUMO-protein ligase PIAS1